MTISGTMATNGNYPSNNGVNVGQTSVVDANFKTLQLHRVNMLIGGTPGSNPVYKIQTLTLLGNWLDCLGMQLTAAGALSGTVEGVAVRLAADNGTSPGTGNNTPYYELEVEHLNVISTGQ